MKSLTPIFILCLSVVVEAVADVPLENVSGGMALEWASPSADDPLLALVPATVRDRVVVATIPGEGPLPDFNGGFGQPSSYPYQLFCGEKRLPLAQYPNEGRLYIVDGDIDFSKPGFKEQNKPDTVKITVDVVPERLALWAKEPELWTEGGWKYDWAGSSVRVRGVDPAARTLELGTKWIRYGIVKGASSGGDFSVLNAFSEMDMPGEWAADLKTRRIYLFPPPEGTNGVEVAMKDSVLTLERVKDLVIEGKVFECSRKDAVVLKECTNVVIRRSIVRNTGGWGIKVEGGRNCRIEGCDIYNTGEGGVSLVGGVRDRLEPGGHVIVNCHLHHNGEWVRYYRPSVYMGGVACRCEHNLIHHHRHAAIIYGGNDQYIGFNVVHDTCTDSYDCGALYTHTKHDWSDRGHLVEYNCVHMTGRPRCPSTTFGIYVDGWSSGVTVRGNIVNRAGYGIFQNGGNDNTYVHNLVMCCQYPMRQNNLGLKGGKNPDSLIKDGLGSPFFKHLLAKRELYDSPLWRTRYPNMMLVFDFEDPLFAHNALFIVATNNAWSVSGLATFVDADLMKDYQTITNNTALDDLGFIDFEGFNWELRPDAPARRFTGGDTRFGEMGLYASPHRVSPPVKFGKGVSLPVRRIDHAAPIVLASVRFAKRPKSGPCAVDFRSCSVAPPWHPDRSTVSVRFGSPPLDADWKRYEFSFTPTLDTDCTLLLEGWRGERTAYDDVRVTGAEIVNGGFEGEGGWELLPISPGMDQHGLATPPYGIVTDFAGLKPHTGGRMCIANFYMRVQQPKIALKKGVPVTISFVARAAVQ